MTVNVLFAARTDQWAAYEPLLRKGFADSGLDVALSMQMDPETVDYIIYAPSGPLSDFSPYVNAKAVLSIWAGVEKIVTNETLTQPLTRMVDHGLAQGMSEWVAGHVLRHHLETDLDLLGQDGVWQQHIPPLAEDRPVTILGLGTLGQSCATTLRAIGFPVTGWSRSPKQVDGITCLSGDDGLKAALKTAQIVVLLLPQTADTENTLNAETLALLPKGAVIINPGRGPLIDDNALLASLDTGHIGHATLDVFRVEPLPADHPYWAHPKVTVTPHIAAETRASSAAQVLVENVRRGEAGEPLRFLVDRTTGY